MIRPYLDLIDTQTTGQRYDVTPLFSDHTAFAALLRDLAEPFNPEEIDAVAGIDALGFILGAGLALQLGKGFIPVRKGGKLPVEVDTAHFVDYTGLEKSLELRKGVVKAGTRVLIVDEWIETGAQVRAAISLVEKQGGVVAGVAAINMDCNTSTKALMKMYRCHTVWRDA